jgi:hypothetical protein
MAQSNLIYKSNYVVLRQPYGWARVATSMRTVSDLLVARKLHASVTMHMRYEGTLNATSGSRRKERQYMSLLGATERTRWRA